MEDEHEQDSPDDVPDTSGEAVDDAPATGDETGSDADTPAEDTTPADEPGDTADNTSAGTSVDVHPNSGEVVADEPEEEEPVLPEPVTIPIDAPAPPANGGDQNAATQATRSRRHKWGSR